MSSAMKFDGRAFPEPHCFRLDRDPPANLLYGAGIQLCPGTPLARLELRLVMEELLRCSRSISAVPEKTPLLARFPASGFSTLPLQIM